MKIKIFRSRFEREGKGIEKDAAKRKPFVFFYETFFTNFWNFVPVNLVYWLTSLLVVTNGIANAGFTNVARNTAREKHSFGVSDYVQTVKKNWKQSLLAGIINTVIYIFIGLSLAFYSGLESGFKKTFGIAVTFTAIIIVKMMCLYLWTLMITFKFSLKQLYVNSFKFVFINMKNNILALLSITAVYIINGALYWLAYILFERFCLVVAFIEILLYIAGFNSFKFLLVQMFVFPSIKKYVIDPYYKDHPDEDIEKRKNLGIYEEPVVEKSEDAEGEDNKTVDDIE